MPLIGLHITVARELADELRHRVINGDRGAFYLGATTPDIRAMTRLDRERTHFFTLNDFGPQSGVHRLFQEQPELKDPTTLDATTAAFMAGYVSHLEMDEAYIGEIYRPFFGERSDVADDLMANVMDRLLLYHLDKEHREDASALEEIGRALTESSAEVAVDFIGRDAIREWRELQRRMVTRPPTFAKMLWRQLNAVGIEGEEAIAAFLEEHAEELLRSTIARIGPERIQQYLLDSKDRARRAMMDYLA